MADDRASTLRRERLSSLAAVAALAIATALVFGRVFVGAEATWKLVAAAAASAVVAGLLERRSLPLATLAAAAALLLAVAWLAFPGTVRFGLPTGDTFSAIGDALHHVGRQAREQVSPTPPLTPLLLAALTAVWAAAFSIHALAVRAGSPLLALIPSAALIGFADSALKGDGGLGFAALFLAGTLAVLLVDSIRRVRQWGTLRPWRGPSGRPRALVVRGAGGLAAVTVLAAMILPGLLPGFGADGLVDLRSHDDGTSIDPLVSIKAQLSRTTPLKLFEVRADRAAYWRMLALDSFDGTTWSTADLDASSAAGIPSGQSIDYREPAGTATFDQHVTVSADLRFPWIPAAFSPTLIELEQSAYRYDPDLSMAVAPELLRAGDTYDVSSRYPLVSYEQLQAEAIPELSPDAREARLPELPDEIAETAQRWTAGATTDLEVILAVQNHLRRFTYDADVEPTIDADAMVAFLLRTRRGFCQQFAGTMAVLLRSLGYPARVAVGFTPGTPVGDGSWSVTSADAHAWVEVQFPDYGWLAFEPTPQQANPIAQAYLSPLSEGCAGGNCPGGERQSGARGSVLGTDRRFLNAARKRDPRHPATAVPAQAGEAGTGFPTGRILLGLAALALLGAVLLPPAKLLRRRLRLASAGRHPRELVLATYDVFTARAADLGLGRSAGETMREYGERLRAGSRTSNGDLERLTTIASRAAYARDGIGRDDATAAQAAARQAFRALRRDRGRLRQLVGIYRPGL
jgi:transglutaminase-like putative cysteine protease